MTSRKRINGEVVELCALQAHVASLRRTVLGQEERIQALCAALAFAEERERKRIATGLHDEVGQLLAMAKLKLHRLCMPDRAADSRDNLIEVCQYVEHAIDSMRSLTFELSSPQLFQLGLVPAVFELADTLGRAHELEIKVSNDLHDKPLIDAAKNLVFQAIRELLFNVIKHARARRATIDLSRHKGHLHVAIRDDGRGFDVARLRDAAPEDIGFGLFSIGQRLRAVSGSMEIESEPGAGATVTIRVPLRD